MLTSDHLKKILIGNQRIDDWEISLNKFLPSCEINSIERISSFIAQCSHESGNFKSLSENLNYGWQGLRKTFPKYFPTDELAKSYERKPEKIANRVYANRMGNGNEESGDGWKYRGRGLIQLTGKNNYSVFANSIQFSLEKVIEYLGTFDGAVHSACWFWQKNNLNSFADIEDIKGMTKIINGGYNGLDDRIKHYEHAKSVLRS